MNDRIKELIGQSGNGQFHKDKFYPHIGSRTLEDWTKFAELIVRECANTIENRAPGQMGKEGEGWTNGYDDGLKTGAFLIKKHFGVEE
jgi:hypothetical protein